MFPLKIGRPLYSCFSAAMTSLLRYVFLPFPFFTPTFLLTKNNEWISKKKKNLYINIKLRLKQLWRGIKYSSKDGSLFFARVRMGQSGTWSLAKQVPVKIPSSGTWELADNAGINLGLDCPPLARNFKISRYTHTHQATTSSYHPQDNGRYGPLGLDIVLLFIVVDNSNFPYNIFKGE